MPSPTFGHSSRKNNWINLTSNDWDNLLPIADDKTKASKSASQDRAVFRLISNGLKSQRDEWVYDFDRASLVAKARHLVTVYEQVRRKSGTVDRDSIKWDRELDRYREKGVQKRFEEQSVVHASYRPFCHRWLYFDEHFNGMTYQLPAMFPLGKSNTVISFSDTGHRADFCALCADGPVDLHFGAAVDAYQVASRYRYSDRGERIDNITKWAVEQFRGHYEKSKSAKRSITEDAIFHYVYGVLHDPSYREKYALNLKREFPRIPFYADFWKWADWGEALMKLHIGYEEVEPWPLERADTRDEKSRKAGLAPKAVLRADKESGNIRLDGETQLTGVPPEAWTYRLGNRSALEWILDQYKEKTPKDPTIREKFNTYRFADHKEKVIDLLKRVTRVSVETMRVVEAMRSEKR
jgi:predicted helicase